MNTSACMGWEGGELCVVRDCRIYAAFQSAVASCAHTNDHGCEKNDGDKLLACGRIYAVRVDWEREDGQT